MCAEPAASTPPPRGRSRRGASGDGADGVPPAEPVLAHGLAVDEVGLVGLGVGVTSVSMWSSVKASSWSRGAIQLPLRLIERAVDGVRAGRAARRLQGEAG